MFLRSVKMQNCLSSNLNWPNVKNVPTVLTVVKVFPIYQAKHKFYILFASFNFFVCRYDSYEAGFSLFGLCLFVTSTFGNGDPPKMAQRFSTWVEEKLTHRDVMVSRRVTFSPFKEEITFSNHESNGNGTKNP